MCMSTKTKHQLTAAKDAMIEGAKIGLFFGAVVITYRIACKIVD